MQQWSRLMVLAMVLALSACASTQRLSDADRAQVKYVAVDKSVEKGHLFLLAPGGANIGMLFGAVGALAVSDSMTSAQNAFGSFVETKGIAIDTIVRSEFEKALRDSNKVTVVQPGKTPAAVISLSVPQYGFGVTHLLSSNVVAVMTIKCVMTDSTGKVLWSESERILPSIASPMDSTTWTELHDSSWAIEDQWRKAARYLAKRVVDRM